MMEMSHQSTNNSQQNILHEETTSIRRWTELPGRNKYCCNGRIIMSRQIGVFYFTVALIIGTLALHLGQDGPYLWVNVSPALPIVSLLMGLVALGQLFKTSFSDPGVVPRASQAEVDYEALITQPNVDTTLTNQYRPPPRIKEVQIRGQVVSLKYCYTCHMFRPPRTSHCSICDNCILNFDHHCPWVGNCVGARNYRHFYFFITTLSILCIVVFCSAMLHLIMQAKQEHQFLTAMKQSPGSLIVILITFFSVWSVMGLSAYHTYLMLTSVTTNEDLKGSFNVKRSPNNRNPYSGTFVTNCCKTLCAPEQPSLIDRRGFIIQRHVACGGPLQGAENTSTGIPPCTVERTNSDNDIMYDKQLHQKQLQKASETRLQYNNGTSADITSKPTSAYGSVQRN